MAHGMPAHCPDCLVVGVLEVANFLKIENLVQSKKISKFINLEIHISLTFPYNLSIENPANFRN